jgi:hypothetical protein
VGSLVDTNILVLPLRPARSTKCECARAVLRRGEAAGDLRIAHQSLVEFVNSVMRSRGTESPLMTREDATRQTELFMAEFPVLYPNQHVFRTALRGMRHIGFPGSRRISGLTRSIMRSLRLSPKTLSMNACTAQ